MGTTRPSAGTLFIILSALLFTAGADVLITTIKDKNIQCDYLIIAPDIFKADAIRLGEHRNTFKGDDVENAHVVLLDSIYSGFTISDTLQKHEIIWYGLKWMYENWKEPFKYVVLMGDDSLVINPTDSSITSFGRMPTFIEGVDPYYIPHIKYSDDWYTTLQCRAPAIDKDSLFNTPLIIGRIPCETTQMCSTYVNKVIAFDVFYSDGPWKNKTVLVADDEFQGTGIDFIQHYDATEKISRNFIEDHNNTKCYLSRFKIDSNGKHPEAKKYFFKHVNEGALWSVFYGHANENIFTDEAFLTVDDYKLFNNVSTPLFFLSFTTWNGNFNMPYKNSMCKQFLFIQQGGCVAYFANPHLTFASQNHSLGQTIFSIKKANPCFSIGKTIYKAKAIEGPLFSQYCLLGDPALTVTQGNATLGLSLLPEGKNPIKVLCTVNSPNSFSGNYYCTFSTIDSVIIDNHVYPVAFLKDSIFDSSTNTFTTSFEIPIPKEAYNKKVRFISYVWNDQYDGRTDTILTLDAAGIKDGGGGIGQSKGFSMKLTRNILSITCNKAVGNQLTELALFNIRGQQILSQKFNTYKNVITIDLNKYNIPTGKYITQIKTKDSYFNKPLIYIK